MLNIAICDDEKEISSELENTLIEILTQLDTIYEIDVFSSGEQLCKQLDTKKYYDLIFLDIEFAKEQINGIDVGKIIRDVHQNNFTSIIFISWEQKYSMQLFDIRPLNFLIKPLQYDKIQSTIKTYFSIHKRLNNTFSFKRGHDTVVLLLKDIVYLESIGRKLLIHLVNGQQELFYGSIKEAYTEQLKNSDFLFIHASYVINFDHISTLKYTEVFMGNNMIRLPISQNNRNQIREQYFKIAVNRKI